MMNVSTVTHSAPRRAQYRIEQAEPGVGYRLLEPFEIIIGTDEVWRQRQGWAKEETKAGKPLLTHWRPRRRKLEVPVVSFPLFWLNGDVVYRSNSERCFGFLWSDRANRWCPCADDRSMVEHVKEWAHVYKPITHERACEIIGSEAVNEGRSVQELYNELLFAVASKHPDESRHETALRYINQAESRTTSLIDTLGAISKSVYGI
jgi:hypothetical protein